MIKKVRFFSWCIFLFFFGCKNHPVENEGPPKLFPVIKDNCLYIGWEDYEVIPDSVLKGNYWSAWIITRELNDSYEILDKIEPDSLVLLRIEKFNKKFFSYDLKRFKKLTWLEIWGDSIKQVKLEGNLGSNLDGLSLQSEEFPRYNSHLLNLKELSYGGAETKIPEWLDKLDSLKEFYFYSKKIDSIKCDVCAMKSIRLFDISQSDLYKEEMQFYEKHGKFNKLEKYKKCKPDLSFKKHVVTHMDY